MRRYRRQAPKTILAAIGITIALTASSRAQFCTTMCSRYEEGECVEHTQTCRSTDSTMSAPSYGAIAYDRTNGAWGYSYHWGSRARAESAAMQSCAGRGKDCEVMVWFDRKCGAVAAAAGANAFWGIGDGEGAARANALAACAKGGGKGCKVQVSQCSR